MKDVSFYRDPHLLGVWRRSVLRDIYEDIEVSTPQNDSARYSTAVFLLAGTVENHLSWATLTFLTLSLPTKTV